MNADQLQYIRPLPQRAYRSTQAPGFVLAYGLVSGSGFLMGLLMGWCLWN